MSTRTKFKEGNHYECILSASPGYLKGEVYTCHRDSGGTYFMGGDGIKDYTAMLVSEFKRVEIGEAAGRLRN